MSRLTFKSGLILSNNVGNLFPTCNSAGDRPVVLCDDTHDGLTPFCLQKSLNSCDWNAEPLFVTIVAGTPYLANHSRNFSVRAFVVVFIILTAGHLEYAPISIIHCLS
ncbi:conserved hypothetical protein [Trichinella spiralis]|uniref:hypothetical protein n=1 Tax=Trichinella spiralis TaxID=6334 RepID=UPI0001EFDFAA|nr:conserved hypothetical protein [Trichinella spiralis]